MQTIIKTLVCAGAVLGLASACPALGVPANQPSNASWQKPAWLTELSATGKEGYDNNVFLSGVDTRYYPVSYHPPAGSAVALKDSGSWVTTVTPKIGVSLLPLLGTNGPMQTLSFGYAPECSIYEAHNSENNQAHRTSFALKGHAGDASFATDNSFTYVNGDRMAPFYPGGYVSAIATGAPRERRKQLQDRANVLAQYDQEDWFVRATGTLLYYDLMTTLTNVSGYQNYADRYDANGGADAGWRLSPGFAFTLGARYGHQYQQHFSFSPYSSSSDYERVLLGMEGRPWKWLEIKIQAGPDFRDYEASAPVDNHHPVKYYDEAALTAAITPSDTLALKCKQWEWVSSVGKVPYFETACELAYHRKFTEKLGWDLGGRYLKADYSAGNIPACRRKDTEYIATTGLAYAVNSHWTVNASMELDFGRNAQDNIPNPSAREFDRQLYTLGAQLKF